MEIVLVIPDRLHRFLDQADAKPYYVEFTQYLGHELLRLRVPPPAIIAKMVKEIE